MMESETIRLAECLMNFFGFADQTFDVRLPAEERDVFHMLEGEGFLTTWQEAVYLETGKIWCVNYWILKTDQIQRMGRQEIDLVYKDDKKVTTYEGISVECWIGSK